MNGRVAYLVDVKRVELREEPVPAPRPGGVVLRVRAALTDGTDLKAYRRGHPRMPFPTRFGHEFSGDVIAIGEGVTAFAPGDAVMSVHSGPCGRCHWCACEEEELCERVMETMVLGAYADYVELPPHVLARNAYAKPSGLSYVEAAFLEPLSCVVHANEMLARTLNPRIDAPVVAVIGDGGFGLLHAQVLRAKGARPLLCGRRPERLQLAERWGVQTANVRGVPLADAILERTGGRGADAVVECTGNPEVWQEAPLLVRRGGIVSLFGGLPSSTQVSFLAARLHYDEVRLISPFHFTPRAVRGAYEMLAERAVEVLPLITRAFPLERIGEAFAQLDERGGIKFAIDPTERAL